MRQKLKQKTWFRWLKRIAVFLLTWILLHVVYITVDGFQDYHGNADVAIILGNRVYGDGSLSTWLKGRVDKALALYRAGKVKKIYASGGISAAEDNHYPEGDAMRNYLVANGVKPEDVIADNAGQNSYLTAKDFLAWNKDQHYQSAIIVSQFYHITRCKYIMRKLGFKNVYGASSDEYSSKDIGGTLREVPAFYKYVLVY